MEIAKKLSPGTRSKSMQINYVEREKELNRQIFTHELLSI